MKKLLLALVLFGVVVSPFSFADEDDFGGGRHQVFATCVGGPRAPSYAFDDSYAAQICANQIASYSKDCAQFVRVGRCATQAYNVQCTNNPSCACNPGFHIGYWN